MGDFSILFELVNAMTLVSLHPGNLHFFFPLQKVWKMNFQPKNLPYAEGMKDHSPVVCRVKFSHYLHSDKLTKLAGMAGPGLSRCISY